MATPCDEFEKIKHDDRRAGQISFIIDHNNPVATPTAVAPAE